MGKLSIIYDIYSNARSDAWRFTLGNSGSRMLLTVGLNPSTATKEKSDTTVAKVEVVARRNGFDGFVMLNLYPVRSTDFNALPLDVDAEAFLENFRQIERLLADNPNAVLWVAWGESILARSYFVDAAKELFVRSEKYGISLWHYGALTNSGHPRHPSRLSCTWSFSRFDKERYLQTLGALHADWQLR